MNQMLKYDHICDESESKKKVDWFFCNDINDPAECANKYAFDIYDYTCVAQQGYVGSSCISKKGCISLSVSCLDDRGLTLYCGWPELTLRKGSAYLNKYEEDSVSRFRSFANEKTNNNCTSTLYVSGKVLGTKDIITQKLCIIPNAHKILEQEVVGSFNNLGSHKGAVKDLHQAIGHEARVTEYYFDVENLNIYVLTSLSVMLIMAVLNFIALAIILVSKQDDNVRLQYVDTSYNGGESSSIYETREQIATRVNRQSFGCLKTALYGFYNTCISPCLLSCGNICRFCVSMGSKLIRKNSRQRQTISRNRRQVALSTGGITMERV